MGTSTFYKTIRVIRQGGHLAGHTIARKIQLLHNIQGYGQSGHPAGYIIGGHLRRLQHSQGFNTGRPSCPLRNRWAPPPSTQRSGCRGQGGHLACHAIGGHFHYLHDSQGNGQGGYLAAPPWVGISTFYKTVGFARQGGHNVIIPEKSVYLCPFNQYIFEYRCPYLLFIYYTSGLQDWGWPSFQPSPRGHLCTFST